MLVVKFGGTDGQAVKYQTLSELLSKRCNPDILSKYSNRITNFYCMYIYIYIYTYVVIEGGHLTFCCFTCCEQQAYWI
jgi:hypothetical protein